MINPNISEIIMPEFAVETYANISGTMTTLEIGKLNS